MNTPSYPERRDMKEANRQGWEACGGMCRMGKGQEQVVERGNGGLRGGNRGGGEG